MANPLIPAIVGRESASLRGVPAVVATASPLAVTLEGGTHPAVSWMGGWQHLTGDRVLVLYGTGGLEVVGSLATRPTSAVVDSTGSGRATVTDDTGRTISGLPYVGTAPGNGTRVGIVWGMDGGFIAGVISATVGSAGGTTSTTDPTPPALPSSSTPGTVTAAATDSATARSGAWRTDGRTGAYVYQGHWTSGSTADNTGYFFFGRGLVVDGATAAGAGTIRLRRDSQTGMGAAANIYLARTAPSSKPGTPPALIGSEALIGSLAYGETKTLPLPAGYAQDLLNGTAGGLVIVYAGTTHYAALYGPDADPSAALVSIPYTKES